MGRAAGVPRQEPHHWDAPGTAYRIAAEWAEELAALRGGEDGQPLPAPPPLGKTWQALHYAARRDVLSALGAQLRAALWDFRRQHNLTDGQDQVDLDITYFAGRMCEHAVGALIALAHPGGEQEWEMPECGHCTGLLATALISFHCAGIMMSGIADPAVLFRSLADMAEI